MAGSPPILLLLLLIQHLSPVFPSCDIEQDFDDEKVHFIAASPQERYITSLFLYFQYKKGFEGVQLRIDGGNDTITVSFVSGEECFAHPTEWWKIQIRCGYLSKPGYVWCVMVGGDCRWYCSKKYTKKSILKFSAYAKGPSGWRNDLPCTENVTWLWRNEYPFDDRSCTGMSHSSTQSTVTPSNDADKVRLHNTIFPLPTIDPMVMILTIVGVVVVGIVVVTLVIAIVILKMRSRKTPRQSPPIPSKCVCVCVCVCVLGWLGVHVWARTYSCNTEFSSM